MFEFKILSLDVEQATVKEIDDAILEKHYIPEWGEYEVGFHSAAEYRNPKVFKKIIEKASKNAINEVLLKLGGRDILSAAVRHEWFKSLIEKGSEDIINSEVH